LLVRQFETGGDRNFAYLAADPSTRRAVLIDPSYAPDRLVDFAEQNRLETLYIFNTHSHYDHTNGNQIAMRRTGAAVLRFGIRDPQTGVTVADNAVLPLGELEIRILHTPGHTPDSICLLIGDALFTGDTLFVGKVGGTDLGAEARAEYDSLHNKILILPGHTRIFPGHDYGTSPQSTVEGERRTNPFLLQPDFKSFVDLKKNWADYKKQHGIN